MVEYIIFHYEDEPQRVDLPGMLEVALYQHPDVERSFIEETDDHQDIRISYRMDGEDYSIRYVIEESIAAAERRCDVSAEAVILHLVDLHIGANAEAGVEIVDELCRRAIPAQRIWMVTAYEAQVRHDLRLAGTQIFPKPSPLAHMTEVILSLIGAGG